MRAGKFSPEKLKELVLTRVGVRRSEVLVRAAVGEDSAVVDAGDRLWVVSTDPITGTSAEIGRLGVHISCNDVASNGAEPLGVQIVLLLPDGTSDEQVALVMGQADQACRELGIEILGGHTEITSKVTDPIVVVTAMGLVERRHLVTSAGARPGDRIWVTKGVGLEGTAILAWELAEELKLAQLGPDLLARALAFSDELSAVREGVAAAKAGATAMHDVTEGGLYGALWELGEAAGIGFRIDGESVPVREETAAICRALDIDPLGLISSGTMLILAQEHVDIQAAVGAVGVKAVCIGWATLQDDGTTILRGATQMPTPKLQEDELWRVLRRYR